LDGLPILGECGLNRVGMLGVKQRKFARLSIWQSERQFRIDRASSVARGGLDHQGCLLLVERRAATHCRENKVFALPKVFNLLVGKYDRSYFQRDLKMFGAVMLRNVLGWGQL
jgi:hypothetical protein